jgi:hypothetical protein
LDHIGGSKGRFFSQLYSIPEQKKRHFRRTMVGTWIRP